jgi:hypothetical protein
MLQPKEMFCARCGHSTEVRPSRLRFETNSPVGGPTESTRINQAMPEPLQMNANNLARRGKILEELANQSGMPRLECLLFALMDELQHTNGLIQSGMERLTTSSTALKDSVLRLAQSSDHLTLRGAWDAASPDELRALFSSGATYYDTTSKQRLIKMVQYIPPELETFLLELLRERMEARRKALTDRM